MSLVSLWIFNTILLVVLVIGIGSALIEQWKKDKANRKSGES